MSAADSRTVARARDLVRQPSALLPLVCSAMALAVVLGHIVMFGPAREPDEGAAAHLWQLLMAGQLPIILWFAVRWLPRTPHAALTVLAWQLGAAVSAALPVYLLHL